MKKLAWIFSFIVCVQNLATLARADEQRFLPYLVIDLAGGAALPGNFLVGGELGPHDLLPSYDTLGWNPRTEELYETFGLPMAAESSKMLAGILSKFGDSANLSNLQFASICAQSIDNSSRNPLSAIALVNRFANHRATFPHYPTGLGSMPSVSGGHQSAVYGDPNASPRPVALESLLASLAQQDPRFSSAFDLQEGNQEAVNNAAIVYALLNGLAPSGVIVLRGYDYAGEGQEIADAKDFQAGKVIGAVAKLAEQLGKPIFIHIVTDGGAVARGDRNWFGDSGGRSMSIMGTAGPIGVQSFGLVQYGYYTAAQTASRETLYGNAPEAPALEAYSEWLHLQQAVQNPSR